MPVPKLPDHVMVPPAQPVAVKVAFSLPHKVVLFVDSTGALGEGLAVIVMLFELPEVPQLVVQVAV